MAATGAPHRTIPGFSLPSSRGVRLGPRDYRQRQSLVIFIAHGLGCAACRPRLEELAAHYDGFRELGAEVLAVVGDPPDDIAGAPYPFPVLSDPRGQVRDQLLGEDAARESPVGVLATDRFGKLFMQMAARDADGLPGAAELLDWVQFIEMQCPECGVPEWPEGE